MIRGIVIGKFYPPHRGHFHLIETALKGCDALTVLVCDHPDQRIPARLRADWIQESYTTVDVRVIPDIGFDDDSQKWASYTKEFLGWTPDVVFTSESYGKSYAQYLGCRHVLVDPARQTVPISATEIRKDPFQSWSHLSPSVRAYFAKRVCILGAESTGTTTLARALAQHFRTVWVPEFGRLYSEGKLSAGEGLLWDTQEFTFIALMQNRLEDQLARECNQLLICDTNSWTTELWHERYLGTMAPDVAALAADRRYALTILTDVDIPFVQDGLRDGAHIRHHMHDRFEAELSRQHIPFIKLSGTHEVRLDKAVAACRAVLKEP